MAVSRHDDEPRHLLFFFYTSSVHGFHLHNGHTVKKWLLTCYLKCFLSLEIECGRNWENGKKGMPSSWSRSFKNFFLKASPNDFSLYWPPLHSRQSGNSFLLGTGQSQHWLKKVDIRAQLFFFLRTSWHLTSICFQFSGIWL